MDLFSLSPGKGPGAAKPSGGAGGGVRSVLDSLPELWEEEQYEEEYNMDTFIKNLK